LIFAFAIGAGMGTFSGGRGSLGKGETGGAYSGGGGPHQWRGEGAHLGDPGVEAVWDPRGAGLRPPPGPAGVFFFATAEKIAPGGTRKLRLFFFHFCFFSG